MSYYLCDSTGYIDDFANINGLKAFRRWASRQPGPLRRFVKQGYTQAVPALRAVLEQLDAPQELRPLQKTLLRATRRAKEVLILTDQELELRAAPRALSERRETDTHKLADARKQRFALAAKYAFAVGRKSVDREALRNAKTESEVIKLLEPAVTAVRKALVSLLTPEIVKLAERAYSDSSKKLKQQFKQLAEHSRESELAAQWAETHAAELAKRLSETSRDEIALAVAHAFEERAKNPDKAWEDLLDDILLAIGDEDRAELIAETEIMRAAHAGRRLAWQEQATAGAKRIWIAMPDCCEECEELDGRTASLNGTYFGGSEGPPLHPRCRCTEELV